MGGVLPPFISLLAIIAAAGAVGQAVAGAEEAMAAVQPAAGKVIQQAAGTTLCCSNMTEYHECVVACFQFYPHEQAAKICEPGCQEAYQCRTVSGDECPSSASGHPSSDHPVITNSVAGKVQLDGTLCCSNMTGFHECVEACFSFFPREQADKICDPGCKEAYMCHTVSGDECPSASEKVGNAVDHCLLGCKSSVCNKMATGAGSKGVAKLHALKRCNKACYKFCTEGGVRAGTSTA